MRTPSMTTQEAEAILGPRGQLDINGENRTIVRKWLVAQGLPSLFVGGLTYTELRLAYNQTSGEMLDKLRAKLAQAQDDIGESEEATPVPPIAPTPASNGHAALNGGDHGAMLAALIAQIAGQSLTPDKVESMMDSKLSSLQDETRKAIAQSNIGIFSEIESRIKTALDNVRSTRIEIVSNGEIRTIDGLSHKTLPELIKAVSAGLPVFLPGPAGGGKTTATEQTAQALGLAFYIQGAVSGTHELLGYKDAAGQYHATPFRQAFEQGGLICLDEIDAGDAGAILVLNAALANCYMAFPDQTQSVQRHKDFRVIACANTFGNGADRLYVGRNQLDAATLDRFYFRQWEYDNELELALCGNPGPYNRRAATKTDDKPETMTAAQWCERVQRLRDAAAKERVRIVISPRASINGAKALAAGLSQKQVEQAMVWKGIDADSRSRIERAI